MANQASISELKSNIHNLLSYDYSRAIENSNWKGFNFKTIEIELKTIVDLFESINSLPIEFLTEGQVQQLNQQCTTVMRSIITPMLNGPDDPRAIGPKHSELISIVTQQYENIVSQSSPIVMFLLWQKETLGNLINKIIKTEKTAQNLITETNKLIAEHNIEFENIILSARDITATKAVAHFSNDFEAESNTNIGKSKSWLIATVITTAITILAALGFLFYKIELEGNIYYYLQIMTTKMVILALLFTATIWCGQQYRTSLHLATINKHKANSLKTFQAFIKAASDESTRSAVLIETTKSIFAHSPSGYINNEQGSDGGIKVVEIIKQFTEAAAKKG